jgi:hypothetical protein
VCSVAPVGSAAQDEAFLSWASESLHPIVSLDSDSSTSELGAIGRMFIAALIGAVIGGLITVGGQHYLSSPNDVGQAEEQQSR